MASKGEHTIHESDDGIRLDRWFKRHYPGLPHAMLEKNLRKGLIRLDGKKAKTSDRVLAGQAVRCPDMTYEEREAPVRAHVPTPEDFEAIRSWVLYKDANIIVVNKPYALAVQGGTKIVKSIDSMLDGLKFDASERPKLIHRLDRDTSGVLVLARSSKIAAKLANAFAGKDIEKTYWALVSNVPQPLEGKIELSLLKGVYGDDLQEKVAVDEEEGKYACTEYRVLDALARKFALVELYPLTGRMHQLRVHMQAIGCPIVGDHKYGGSTNAAKSIGVENILHLHARRIVIPAAITGKKIDIYAPLPEHMVTSFRALGLDVPKK